jgi:hypothetical protein
MQIHLSPIVDAAAGRHFRTPAVIPCGKSQDGTFAGEVANITGGPSPAE